MILQVGQRLRAIKTGKVHGLSWCEVLKGNTYEIYRLDSDSNHVWIKSDSGNPICMHQDKESLDNACVYTFFDVANKIYLGGE